MNRPEPDSPAAQARAQAAADWLVKRDRGLTAEEQDAFLQWLAEDPRHGEWLALHRRTVGDFACLAQWRPEHSEQPNPDLLARPQRRLRWFLPATLAAAAALTLLLAPWSRWSANESTTRAAGREHERRLLADGSTVDLHPGATISVTLTAQQREVVLERGEALFTVAKDASRPFIVRAHGVDVRAVGTAFNVRLDSASVEVLVTEGRVQVRPPAPAVSSSASGSSATAIAPLSEQPIVEAGQRATISLAAATPPAVVAATPQQTARLVVRQPQLLDFSSVALERAVAEMNRYNRVQFVVADAELAAMPIVASIRSDNVDGFARFLADTPGVQVERRGDTEIVLRRRN